MIWLFCQYPLAGLMCSGWCFSITHRECVLHRRKLLLPPGADQTAQRPTWLLSTRPSDRGLRRLACLLQTLQKKKIDFPAMLDKELTGSDRARGSWRNSSPPTQWWPKVSYKSSNRPPSKMWNSACAIKEPSTKCFHQEVARLRSEEAPGSRSKHASQTNICRHCSRQGADVDWIKRKIIL